MPAIGKQRFRWRIWWNRRKSELRHPIKTLRFQVHWKWCATLRWWYRVRHGIVVGIDGSMLPNLGCGKYVDVFRKGNYIVMHDHCRAEEPYTIRLIPYQPNHGVMVEYVRADGRVGWRTHMDAKAFKSHFENPKYSEKDAKDESKKDVTEGVR